MTQAECPTTVDSKQQKQRYGNIPFERKGSAALSGRYGRNAGNNDEQLIQSACAMMLDGRVEIIVTQLEQAEHFTRLG